MVISAILSLETQLTNIDEVCHEFVVHINRLRTASGVPMVRMGQSTRESPPEKISLIGSRDFGELVKGEIGTFLDPNLRQISVSGTLETGKPRLDIVLDRNDPSEFMILASGSKTTYQREVRLDFRMLTGVRSIRISEDGAPYSAWKPYRSGGTYVLKGEGGNRTVQVELKMADSRIQTLSDSIYLQDSEFWPKPGEQITVTPLGKIPLLTMTQSDVWEYPLIFPVLGGTKWTDTWGASRGGGTRKHEGQDLMCDKMRLAVASFDGIFYGSELINSHGVSVSYLHLNNDTPGTDDGKGGDIYYYAPGVYSGMKVQAGQHIGYVGDSGNAENTSPHLHFELHLPEKGVVNAARSLSHSRIIESPVFPLEYPGWLPAKGNFRWDAQVQTVSEDGLSAKVSIAATIDSSGKVTPVTRITERTVQLSNIWLPIKPRDFVLFEGKVVGKQSHMEVARAKILRKPKNVA